MIMPKGLNEAGDLSGKKVIVRVDFNVPIKDGEVVEDYRIRKTLPTIDFLRKKGAKTILISHFEDKNKKAQTLRPVHSFLQKITPGLFFAGGLTELKEIEKSMNPGQTVLLENLRFWDGEKANDENFTKRLASLGDIFVNEAFSASHRKHASIVGLPKLLPGYIGFLFEEEIKNLSGAFSPDHPFLFILGGAKIETKLPLLKKFLETADDIFIGGVLANDFFRAKGFEVGKSVVSKEAHNYSKILESLRIVFPERVLVASGNGEEFVKTSDSLNKDDSIKDNVIKGFEKLEKIIKQAKFILWNGPSGNLEEGFGEGTRDLANLIIESQAKTIVGGGDTISIFENSVLDKFSFVSTGGGAMLDFLANETLPGIEALS